MVASKKILIVEDSTTIQNLLQKVLIFINYETILAKNGLEALEQLKENNVGVILLDLEMKVMDGISCIQSIRNLADKAKANVPVVAVTGNALDLSRKEFYQLSFTDIILKPIDFPKLNKILQKYLHVSSERNVS